MNMHFLEPLDVLFLRGNRLFGEPGSYGESLIPPRPSVAAGAIRSAILARDGVELAAFSRGEVTHASVGRPAEPGPFRITDFQLAWHGEEGEGPLQRLYPLPADLIATRNSDEKITLHRLQPHALHANIESSMATPLLPVLAQSDRAKPVDSHWITDAGIQRWLAGELPDPEQHVVSSEKLWAGDERVGIGMDRATRRADEGKLFTLQAAALKRGVGFVAATEGDALADGTTIRLGGDGRGAVVRLVETTMPEPDYEAICRAGRCRILLTSPGIFPDGWRLPGCDADYRLSLGGISGRLVCAAVPRAEVISGWDLARWQPKPAQRVSPAGSVYWIEELDADPGRLRKLADHGLWPDVGYDAQRRAEGFNCFTFATY